MSIESDARREALECLRGLLQYGASEQRAVAARAILDATASSQSAESAPAEDPVVEFLGVVKQIEGESPPGSRVALMPIDGGLWIAHMGKDTISHPLCCGPTPMAAVKGLLITTEEHRAVMEVRRGFEKRLDDLGCNPGRRGIWDNPRPYENAGAAVRAGDAHE